MFNNNLNNYKKSMKIFLFNHKYNSLISNNFRMMINKNNKLLNN